MMSQIDVVQTAQITSRASIAGSCYQNQKNPTKAITVLPYFRPFTDCVVSGSRQSKILICKKLEWHFFLGGEGELGEWGLLAINAKILQANRVCVKKHQIDPIQIFSLLFLFFEYMKILPFIQIIRMIASGKRYISTAAFASVSKTAKIVIFEIVQLQDRMLFHIGKVSCDPIRL